MARIDTRKASAPGAAPSADPQLSHWSRWPWVLQDAQVCTLRDALEAFNRSVAEISQAPDADAPVVAGRALIDGWMALARAASTHWLEALQRVAAGPGPFTAGTSQVAAGEAPGQEPVPNAIDQGMLALETLWRPWMDVPALSRTEEFVA
jgi:hypothetical protein